MKRRSFITGMLAACVAPMWLPSAGRVWVPQRATGFPFAADPYPIRLAEPFDPITYTGDYIVFWNDATGNMQHKIVPREKWEADLADFYNS